MSITDEQIKEQRRTKVGQDPKTANKRRTNRARRARQRHDRVDIGTVETPMAVETLTADKPKAADKPAQDPWPSQTVGNPIAVGKLPHPRHRPRLFFRRGISHTTVGLQITPQPVRAILKSIYNVTALSLEITPQPVRARSKPCLPCSEVVLRAY